MRCPRCGYEWEPKIHRPKECPRCKQRLDSELRRARDPSCFWHRRSSPCRRRISGTMSEAPPTYKLRQGNFRNRNKRHLWPRQLFEVEPGVLVRDGRHHVMDPGFHPGHTNRVISSPITLKLWRARQPQGIPGTGTRRARGNKGKGYLPCRRDDSQSKAALKVISFPIGHPSPLQLGYDQRGGGRDARYAPDVAEEHLGELLW